MLRVLISITALSVALSATTGLAKAPSKASETTQVFEAQHLTSEQLAALYGRLFGPKAGRLIVTGPRLLIKDVEARLANFGPIVRALDTRAHQGTRIYARPARHRLPSELISVVKGVMHQKTMVKPPPVVLVPDDRSGHIIVRTSPKRYRQIDRLLRRLDRPHPAGKRLFVTEGADRARALGWTQ